MATLINPTINTTHPHPTVKTSAYSRFIHWCASQDRNRFGWLAAALSVHGCALTPITLFAIILSGTSILFFVLALVAMGAALVTNLAAMPTRITIPVFLLTVIIDLGIILACVATGFNIAGTYI